MKYLEGERRSKWTTFHLEVDEDVAAANHYDIWAARFSFVDRVRVWCEEHIPKGDWKRYSSTDSIAIRVDSPYVMEFKFKWC